MKKKIVNGIEPRIQISHISKGDQVSDDFNQNFLNVQNGGRYF